MPTPPDGTDDAMAVSLGPVGLAVFCISSKMESEDALAASVLLVPLAVFCISSKMESEDALASSAKAAGAKSISVTTPTNINPFRFSLNIQITSVYSSAIERLPLAI